MTAEVFGLPAPGDQPVRQPVANVLDTVLDDLTALANDEDVVIYGVPRRPSWEVRYTAAISDSELLIWRQAAQDPSSPLGHDRLLLGEMVLAAKCVGIVKDGEDVTDEHGRPVTFQTKAFQTKLGVATAELAVHAFYGRDPDVLAASDELHRDAGWAGGVPTKRR